MTSDVFAERFAAVRQRFTAKLDSRINEIESSLPQLGPDGAADVLAQVHRHAHDLCGVGPTMGFVAVGKAAREIEQLLVAALKTGRMLTAEEQDKLRQGISQLRSAAATEVPAVGKG